MEIIKINKEGLERIPQKYAEKYGDTPQKMRSVLIKNIFLIGSLFIFLLYAVAIFATDIISDYHVTRVLSILFCSLPAAAFVLELQIEDGFLPRYFYKYPIQRYSFADDKEHVLVETTDEKGNFVEKEYLTSFIVYDLGENETPYISLFRGLFCEHIGFLLRIEHYTKPLEIHLPKKTENA